MTDQFVPEAVRKASQRSDELIAEGQKTTVAPAGGQDQLPEGKTSVEDGGTPAQPAAEKASEVTVDSWKQKYSVLQGKYNAEVPRLNAKVHALNDEIARLTGEIARMKEGLAGSGKANKPAAGNTDDDDLNLDEFGFDESDKDDPIYKTADRVNKLNSKFKEVSETLNKIKETVGSVEEDRTVKAKQAFEQDLKTLVGEDFDEINVDPEFTNWLKTDVDPTTNRPRWAWFVEAYQSFDSPRLAVFFNAFRDTRASRPAAAQPAPVTPKPKVPANVQPSTRRAEAPRTGREGERIWTGPDIKAFYAAVAKGEYAGRLDEKQSIERDIFLAQKEGRIR